MQIRAALMPDVFALLPVRLRLRYDADARH